MAVTERNWSDLGSPAAFDRCVRASISELYGFAGILCGDDRDAAERLVTGVYASLRRAVDGGLTDSVSLSALRSAVRRRWIDDRRLGLLAQVDEARRDMRPAATISELREVERAVLVLQHVNRMPVDRIAEELGMPERRVEQIEASARERLHGDGEANRRWIRQYYGDAVYVGDDLVGSVLGTDAAEHAPVVPVASAEARSAEPDEAVDPEGGDGMASDDEPDEPDAPDEPAEPDEHVEPDGGPPTMAVPVPDAPGHADTDELDTVTASSVFEAVGVGTDDPAAPEGLARASTTSDDDAAEKPAGGRRWVTVVAGVVLIGGLVAALALWLARDAGSGADSTVPASGPSSGSIATVASTGAVPVAGATTPPGATTLLAAAAPTQPGATTPDGQLVSGFDPPCAERAPVATDPPALDEAALDPFAPLGSAPNLVISLPGTFGGTGVGDPSTSALRVPGGVLVTALAGEGQGASLVARIDADGTVRWVRCFAETVFVRGQSGAALADTVAVTSAAVASGWQELSLADGSLGAEVPEPPFAAELTEGEPAPWPDPALATLPGDVFTAGATNGVTIVLGCLVLNADGVNCDQAVLRGYNTADNALLWSRDGVTDVAMVKDGLAVIQYALPDGNPAWYMVDAADGTAVDGQVWADPATFFTECCADTYYSWVVLSGGVVARGDYGSVSIWYPAGAGIGTASVALA